jgi:hypothetical protein
MIDLADVLGGVHQLEAAALAATSTECATKWAKVSKSASKRQVKAQLAHLDPQPRGHGTIEAIYRE